MIDSPARTLALVTLTASLVACQRPAEPKTDPAKTAKTDPAKTDPAKTDPAKTDPAKTDPKLEPEPAKPEPAKPIVYYVGSQLWRIDAVGSQPRALDFEVSPENPGMDEAVGEGDSTPTISRDGRWLAWVDAVDLWVTEFGATGPSKHQITKMPAQKDEWIKAASISFSTWSPDSSTLIVHLREPGYMDEVPLPLPTGISYGFQVLRSGDLGLVHAAHIEGVEGWTPDSKAVLAPKYVAQNDYQLMQYPVDPGPAKQLRSTTDGYGFTQLHVNGDWLAWNSSEHGSQIVIAPLAGGEPKPMSPTGAFADIQWPAVAPDGAHVTFQLEQQTQLGAGPDTAKPLAGVKQAQWYDAEQLLATTSEGLVLLDLDGKPTVLDPAATGLVRY